jgi:hypothetical protein
VSALRAEYAYLLTHMLADNDARTPSFGPNSALVLSRPAAAKTGTTNDFRDNLVFGFTPDLITGVWVGNADYSPMYGTTGLSGAGPIWHDFMERAHEGKPIRDFDRPSGIIEREICADPKLPPGGDCPEKRIELFVSDEVAANPLPTAIAFTPTPLPPTPTDIPTTPTSTIEPTPTNIPIAAPATVTPSPTPTEPSDDPIGGGPIDPSPNQPGGDDPIGGGPINPSPYEPGEDDPIGPGPSPYEPKDDPIGGNPACNSYPSGEFVNLWYSYQNKLGCPLSGGVTVPTIAEEAFQGGTTFWRSDTDEVYIIYDRLKSNGNQVSTGQWDTAGNWRWDGSNPDGVGMSPPHGLVEPKRGFGWLWRTHLGGADGPLGWALDREYGFDNIGRAQNFERGLMFKGSSGRVYMLLYDGQFYAQ